MAQEVGLRRGIDDPARGVQPGHQSAPFSVTETGDIQGVGRDLLQIDGEALIEEVVHAQTGLGNVPVSCGVLDHGLCRDGDGSGLLQEIRPVHIGAEEAGEEGGGGDLGRGTLLWLLRKGCECTEGGFDHVLLSVTDGKTTRGSDV